MMPKFRAWDEENKRFLDEEEFIIISDGRVLVGDWMTGNDFSYGYDDPERFILMQSTGLLDKNGVEIYEGDIIGWRYVITYVDSSQPGNLGMSIGFYAQRDDFESYHMLDVGDEYEVLGNVYENPELLEVE